MFSIVALVCAGLVLTLCADQWLEYAHNDIQDDPSIVEMFNSISNIHKESEQERVSPLVSQAGEFALIIDPPKPPEVKKEEPPQPRITQPSVAYAPRPSAKFKLLSTSYNRDRPEDSVALISEEEFKGEEFKGVRSIYLLRGEMK